MRADPWANSFGDIIHAVILSPMMRLKHMSLREPGMGGRDRCEYSVPWLLVEIDHPAGEPPVKDIVNTWDQFKSRWHGLRNFLLEGECFPLEYELPPLDQIVDTLRHDPDARIQESSDGGQANRTDISAHFRALPIERAMDERFTLAHFKLANFFGPGQLLDGFEEAVLNRWRNLLTDHGFAFNRCYPIIFISGKGCGSSYHMDFSHVMAWQRYGTKRFRSFRDPHRWTPTDVRKRFFQEHGNYHEWFSPPVETQPEDIHELVQSPGTALWNTFLTPHWVLAGADEVAMSINLSHGGLRLADGPLCPHESELETWRAEKESAK